jgi:hypothetical protein
MGHVGSFANALLPIMFGRILGFARRPTGTLR